MTNVRGIATEAAAAIVERLIGRAPAGQDVANAVAEVLKIEAARKPSLAVAFVVFAGCSLFRCAQEAHRSHRRSPRPHPGRA
jgi:hypothetical protein